jgi:hypothetical protein
MWSDQRNSSIWNVPFKKISGRQCSVRSWGALGLVLPFALVLGLHSAAAQNQTINLTTGWTGQGAAGPAIGILQPDDDWRVTADPLVTSPLPRPATVVSSITTTHIKWPTTLPNSGWISGIGNKYMGLLPAPPTHFTYQACFNLPPTYSTPTLSMQMRADDIIKQVRLNSTALYTESNSNALASATKAGSFLGPALAVNYQSTAFQAGNNCVDIDVDDKQQLISGLNATVAVTYCNVPQQDLSTGVAPWKVNAATAYATQPYPGWATKDPNGVSLAAFPAGTQWIQPANSTTSVNEPGGTFTYVLKFNLQCKGPVKVHGWFAADNAASMQIDSNTVVPCAGPPNYCFQQASVTSFSQNVAGVGTHTITFKVTNLGTVANPSPTGLLAHITMP